MKVEVCLARVVGILQLHQLLLDCKGLAMRLIPHDPILTQRNNQQSCCTTAGYTLIEESTHSLILVPTLTTENT